MAISITAKIQSLFMPLYNVEVVLLRRKQRLNWEDKMHIVVMSHTIVIENYNGVFFTLVWITVYILF